MPIRPVPKKEESDAWKKLPSRKSKLTEWEKERRSLREEDPKERERLLEIEKSKRAKKRGGIRVPKGKAHGGMAKKSGTHLNFNKGGLVSFHKLSK